MHRIIVPYSYGLARRRRRIYNDRACSGGQGVRSSRRMLPLEATRPGLPEARWRFRRNVILLRALRASSTLRRSGQAVCTSITSAKHKRAARAHWIGVPWGRTVFPGLTRQPVHDAAWRAGQAECQRPAHQHLVAIECRGWWGQRGLASWPGLMVGKKRIVGTLFPNSRDFGPFCALAVPFAPECLRLPAGSGNKNGYGSRVF